MLWIIFTIRELIPGEAGIPSVIIVPSSSACGSCDAFSFNVVIGLVCRI